MNETTVWLCLNTITGNSAQYEQNKTVSTNIVARSARDAELAFNSLENAAP